MRLPINFLLWTAAIGLGGASGWQFWQALQERNLNAGNRSQTLANKVFNEKIEAGKARAGAVAVGPNYAEPVDFWNSFRDANFTGKEPPKPVDPVVDRPTDTGPAKPVKTPLDDILVLAVLVADGPDSRAMIRYRATANVTPPPDAIAPATSGGDTVLGGPGGARPVGLPTAGDGLGPVHHLMIGDRLWNPHQNIRLARVDETGDYAVFVREDSKVEEAEWEEEKLYKAVLELPQDVIKKLVELGVASRETQARPLPDPAQPGVAPTPNGWIAGTDTREIDGKFHVGSTDRDLFRNDPRIFSERLGTASYRSRTGNVSGVQITSVPNELRGYGLQLRDIIIAVNGEPVSGKAEGFSLGRRLYDRGVRNFEIRFLRNGSEMTRSYVAPDDR